MGRERIVGGLCMLGAVIYAAFGLLVLASKLTVGDAFAYAVGLMSCAAAVLAYREGRRQWASDPG